MDRLQITCDEFLADLKRIEHLIDLVQVMRRFGASEIPETLENKEWDAAEALWHGAKERRTDLPLISGSLLMYLAGRFEFYVRQLVEVTAEEMARKVDSYLDLPEKYRHNLKKQVLEIAQNPSRYGFDNVGAEGHLKDFTALLNSKYDPNHVSSALLSLTEANLKSRVLTDITKRLGMKDLWKEVGKQASLKLALDTATDGETTAEAMSKLDSLMDDRNALAHPTDGMTFPDPEKVIETAKFIKAFSQSLRDLFLVYLAQWDPEVTG